MNADTQAAYTQAGIRVLEQDGPTLCFELLLPTSTVVIIANFVQLERALLIEGAHVEGTGLTRTLIRKFANSIGQIEKVAEVIIQGGKRSSGRRIGSLPTPIRVKVQS